MILLKKSLTLAALAVSLTLPLFAGQNDYVRGIKRPKICLDSNIRCILKQHGRTQYWCLKSNIQRELDSRRTTQPITKTRGENMGHCAEIIVVDSTYTGETP